MCVPSYRYQKRLCSVGHLNEYMNNLQDNFYITSWVLFKLYYASLLFYMQVLNQSTLCFTCNSISSSLRPY